MRSGLLIVAVTVLLAPRFSAAEERLIDAPPRGQQVWPSQPPKDCPFPPSQQLGGIFFTGVHSDYHCGDTWYPSIAVHVLIAATFLISEARAGDEDYGRGPDSIVGGSGGHTL
jgi:hypothetical protein